MIEPVDLSIPATPTMRFAVYREPGKPVARLMLSSTTDQKINLELSGDGTDTDGLRECLAQLKEFDAPLEGSDQLGAAEVAIRQSLESRSFKMERLPDGDVEVEFGIDLNSGRTFGRHKALHAFTQAQDDIGRNIQAALSQVFDQSAEKHVATIRSALERSDHEGAARIAIDLIPELIFIANSRPLLDAICAIERQHLSREQAIEIQKIVVSLASKQHRDDLGGAAAEELLREDTALDEETRFGLKNMIAVAALKRGETETGLAMIRDLLRSADQIDAVQRGWIWRNLSMALDPVDPEAQRAAQSSIDAFLQAGDKQEAARSIAQLSHLQERGEPTEAVLQFDKMLDLMSEKGVLDEEIRANIHHAKGRKLLELGNSHAALEAAQKAVGLRRGILGAEEGLISSLHLAAIAASQHDDQATKTSMDVEARELEAAIGSEHFNLARRVAALLATWDAKEAKSLLAEAEQTRAADKFACIHVAVAINDPSLTSLQRLGKLEATLKGLDRRGARPGPKYPVRLAIAQILKEQGEFRRAADWYRKILADQPLDTQIRQFLVDALWQGGEWGEAVIFLRQQLDAYGDRPGLLYAYGRSLFEAGNLSEAVGAFTSALVLADDNPDLQQTIRNFRERAVDLGGVPLAKPAAALPDAPASLDELRAALKEFATFVSGSKRMDFWERPKGATKHKWRQRPEKHGQTLLHTYLKASFKERIAVYEEIAVGAGRLDLFVHFAGGLAAIIELKMCGNTYSTEYARSGEDQIEHYMDNRKVHIGFLIVFDARARDNNGMPLIAQATGRKNTIEETVIDVRSSVKPN